LTELNAWGGKVRPTPESITNPEHFQDPPRSIQRAMGGKLFFFDIGATNIHRVGLFKGLGWRLPYPGVAKDITYVKILHEGKSLFTMFFGKVNHQSNFMPDTIEEIESVKGVPLAELREVYERHTIDK